MGVFLELPFSSNWVGDIDEMLCKFGTYEKLAEMPRETKLKYLDFRIKFLDEEMRELRKALDEGNAADVVDAHIDLCVFAIGTLLCFDVDAAAAWDEVHVS